MIDIFSVESEVAAMNAELDKIKKGYQERIKATFEPAFKSFLKQYPSIYAFRWTQYTPHFNDGDECSFEVHELDYVLKHHAEDFRSGDLGPEEGQFAYGDKEEVQSRINQIKRIMETRDDTPIEIKKIYPVSRCFQSDYQWDGFRNARNPSPGYNQSKAEALLSEYQRQLNDILKDEKLYPDREGIKEALKKLQAFIRSVDEEIMEAVFGSHVQVTVTRDGITIEEYEHD